MRLRGTWLIAGFLSLSACAGTPPPTTSSTTAPTSDPGPPPNVTPTDGATITLSSSGVSPKQVRVYQGSRVTFVDRDGLDHQIQSDPLHIHTDCPALNAVDFLVAGQTRVSDPLSVARACGFHDHLREAEALFTGTVFVDPR